MEMEKLEELLKTADVLQEMASTRRISPELVPIVAEALKKEVKYLYAAEIHDDRGHTEIVLMEGIPPVYDVWRRPWVEVDYRTAIVVASNHKWQTEVKEYLDKHKKVGGFPHGDPAYCTRGLVTLYRLLERHPDDPFGRGGGM
ncbi:MAG: hypothetical protein KKD17_03125 [Nanoarchaeota archaeon]|nr:hypothetical protein [Nanoarchaeota archaeon]